MNTARAVMLLALVLPLAQRAQAQVLSEDQFVIIPLRVHILTAQEIDAVNCKLTDADVARVIGHVNDIWHRAGVHFGLESVVREPAEQVERFRATIEARGRDPGEELQMLLPRSSRTCDGLHVYFFHQLPYNAAFVGDDTVLASETAELRRIKGGADDAVARVTAHALGNALGLPNHTDPRSLMGGGTSGVALNASQGEAARLVAKTLRGATTIGGLSAAVLEAKARKDDDAARRFGTWLSEARAAVVAAANEAKARAAAAPKPDPDQILIVPLRVHVLIAADIEIAKCTLSDAEITRVIDHVNAIWRKAGIYFGVESIVREGVDQRERFKMVTELAGGEPGDAELRMLMPRASRVFDGLHVYFFHSLGSNGSYVGDDVVVAQEAPQLRTVKGGGNDPIARVTAHALGNVLGLTNHGEPRNVMANGTSGIELEDTQGETASKVARTVRGVATVSDVRKAALAAEARGDRSTAARLRAWLAEAVR
jgi:hypothetical protein